MKDILVDLYRRCVDDNKEDFMQIIENYMNVIGKLCAILMSHGIINEKEVEIIMDPSKDLNNLKKFYEDEFSDACMDILK